MSLSAFMQFGSEATLAAKDVGQPKFRLVGSYTKEPLYVLLGSLHMPFESDTLISQAEAHVNQAGMRSLLLNALAHTTGTAVAVNGRFEYVHRNPSGYVVEPPIRRNAHL